MSETTTSTNTHTNEAAHPIELTTMLCSLDFGLPRQSVGLDEAAQEVQTKAHAADGTVKASMFYWKYKEGTREVDGLKPLKDFQREYRKAILAKARYPFSGGCRLVPAAELGELIRIKEHFDNQRVGIFEGWLRENYPGLLHTAPARMGQLYNAQNFPTVTECRFAFSAHVDIFPLGQEDQIRHISLLSPNVAATLERAHSEQLSRAIERAHVTIWEDVMKPLSRMVKVLDSKNPKIHESLIDALNGVVAQVQAFDNVVHDERLKQMADQAQMMFGRLTADQLRESEAVRKEALQQAKGLITNFSPYARKFADVEEEEQPKEEQ